jgi:hypothetical protein
MFQRSNECDIVEGAGIDRQAMYCATTQLTLAFLLAYLYRGIRGLCAFFRAESLSGSDVKPLEEVSANLTSKSKRLNFPRRISISTSRARDLHLPRSFLVCVLSLWLTLNVAHALDPNKRLTQYAHTAWRI